MKISFYIHYALHDSNVLFIVRVMKSDFSILSTLLYSLIIMHYKDNLEEYIVIELNDKNDRMQ